MITVNQLADEFEKGLNNILNNPEIQFKIWAEAGEHKRAHRSGNTVTYFINGNLRTSTSSNDANDLVMGVNGLSLEFAVPVQRPRTNSTQTADELEKIQDGQYPFVTYIISAVNGYFQKAQAIQLTDDKGVEFSVAFQGGTVTPGIVDLAPVLGNYLSINVYIEVYFIQGGISSKNVKITFDNTPIPFLATRYGRTPVTERDVCAGNLVSKNIVTSSAFAVDVEFPVTEEGAAQSCIDYLLSGEPNTAYFVKVKFGELKEQIFLMTFNTVQVSAQGIAAAGATASLMEVIDNISAINLPEEFKLDKLILSGSDVTSVQYEAEEKCFLYCAMKTYALEAGESIEIPLSPANIEYDEESDGYFVYFIVLNLTGETTNG